MSRPRKTNCFSEEKVNEAKEVIELLRHFMPLDPTKRYLLGKPKSLFYTERELVEIVDGHLSFGGEPLFAYELVKMGHWSLPRNFARGFDYIEIVPYLKGGKLLYRFETSMKGPWFE